MATFTGATKHAAAFTGVTKPGVKATGGLYYGFMAFTYSGGQNLPGTTPWTGATRHVATFTSAVKH